ncbi:MAG: metallophosphoesterase [Pseudomonadota bacterium]
MPDFTLVVISDTHISRTHPYFFHNWDVTCEAVNALAPDVVVVTGDVSFNGPDRPDDLSFAAGEMARLKAPVCRVLPGNHDLGYSPAIAAEQALTAARREAYLAAFGPDFWTFDHGAWRFIGLNPFLLESGLAAEAEQEAMIDAALEGHGGPVGVFTHVPFFAHRPDETDGGTSATIRPGPRAALLGRFARSGAVRFVASGHLHRYKRMSVDGIEHVWAPGTAFMSTGPRSNAWGGEPWVGFVSVAFEGERFTAGVVEPDDMINMDLRNWNRGARHGYYRIAAQAFRRPDVSG